MSFIIVQGDAGHIVPTIPLYFCRVKKTIALFFFFLLSFQHLYALGYTGWFYSNRDAIATKHCINKNRPALSCNGKCFLSQKMKEAEQHQQEDRDKTETPVLQLAPCEKETTGLWYEELPFKPIYSLYLQDGYTYQSIVELLRPPALGN